MNSLARSLGLIFLFHSLKESGKLLLEVWKRFELILLDADEFVAKQTPIKAQGLHDSIKVCNACCSCMMHANKMSIMLHI